MRQVRWTLCAVAVLSMAACGSKDTKTAGGSGVQSGKAAPAGAASAEQVAKEMRGKVKCPAKASAERPGGAPVDDVVGVRPGMSWDEAANFVMCDNPLMVVSENTSRNYNINTFGHHIRQGFDGTFAQPRVVKTSQQIFQEMQQAEVRRSNNAYVAPLQPGQSRYFVSTMGMPGEEKVLSVAREEYYPADKLPTVDSLKQALIAKYGPPTRENDGQTTYLSWEFDPSGARVAPNSSLANACGVNPTPDTSISLSTACGVSVGAAIEAASSNPGLAHSLAVTSQNGTQGMAFLKATADAFQQADDARKANELSNASKKANAPKL
jgi:hypothetical protein